LEGLAVLGDRGKKPKRISQTTRGVTEKNERGKLGEERSKNEKNKGTEERGAKGERARGGELRHVQRSEEGGTMWGKGNRRRKTTKTMNKSPRDIERSIQKK